MIRKLFFDPLGGRRPGGFRPAGMGLLLTLFFLMTACFPTEELVGVEEITEDPQDYVGEEVTIHGKVEEAYGDRILMLDEQGLFGKDLFVITDRPLDAPEFLEGNFVQVTGTVRRFAGDEIEELLGLGLDPEVTGQLSEGEPVIIAQEVIPSALTEDFEGLGGGIERFEDPGLDEFEPGFEDPFEPGIDEPGLE